MKETIGLVSILAALTACGGGDGDLLAAIPANSFAGRTAEIVLVGDGTDWGEGATVDFGEGVTVDSVEPVGGGALVATITAAPDAALGMRDITVNGSTLSEGFELQNPISLEVQGTIAQGSISIVSITNNDVANPFDATSTGDGFFTPIEYTNFVVTADGDLDASINFVEPFAAELLVLVDVNAAEGTSALEIASGATGEELLSLSELTVTARSPMQLSAGTPASGNVDTAFDSVLYELTPDEFSILDLQVTTTNQDANPQIALLPASGSFADLLVFGGAVMQPGDEKIYAVVWENTGIAPYDYTLSAATTPAAEVPESEDNNDSGMAQAVASLPAVVTGGSLSSVSDEDWYEVTIAAGDVGMALHVVTLPGDGGTDTVVEVFAADGTTTVGGPSDDRGVHEDWVSGELTQAGTYYVKVSASVDFFNPQADSYDALIELVEAPEPEE